MPDQLATLVVIHDEPVFGQGILPKFSRIVKENPRKQEIEVQVRVERRDLLRDAHHLRGVLDESAAPRVMIITRGGSATESVTPFF